MTFFDRFRRGAGTPMGVVSFNALLRSLAVGVAVIGTDRRLRFCSRTANPTLGYGADELEGLPPLDLIHPEDRDGAMCGIAQCLATPDAVVTTELRLRTKAGGWRYAEAVAINRVKEPALRGVVVTVRDIAARKEAELQRQRSDARYQALFDAAPYPMWVYSAETMAIRDVNSAALLEYGYSREEFLRLFLHDISPEEAPHRPDQLPEGHVCDDSAVWSTRHQRKDRSMFDVELSVSPVVLDGMARFIVVAKNITQRMRAEEALRQSELAFRQIIEEAADAMLTTDESGRIIDMNAKAERLTGYSRSELTGLNAAVLCAPGEEQLVAARIELLCTGAVVTAERQLQRRDGSTVLIETSAKRLPDGRLHAIMRDISARKDEEDRARQSQKLEALGELAGGIAHDFNNLLTVILANAEALAESIPAGSDEQNELRDLRQAARRGAAMIRKLSAFSRHEPVVLQPAALFPVAEDVMRMIARLIPEHITPVLHCDPDLPPVLTDAGAVEQCLLNLATNARDAMPNGGELTLTVTRCVLDASVMKEQQWAAPGDHVCLAVSDTGTGMDAETQRRAFEPYFTTKPIGHGTGLGLSMVYGLVKQLHGFAQVDSTLGEGTVVRIYLPVLSAPAATTATAARSSLSPVGTETVLFVEDDDAIRRVAERSLTQAGYHVIPAANGKLALALYREHFDAIDLIVTDMIMPSMGGHELHEAIRKEGARVPFVFSSGHDTEEMAIAGPAGNAHHLNKPWTVRSLLDLVREALDAPAIDSRS